ncbi:acetate--CoA ligase [bacterium]|nr:acetate--CoA ligase [bacterium]
MDKNNGSKEESGIQSVLHEERVFSPPPESSSRSPRWLINSKEEYERLYEESISDPATFYGRIASELSWFTPWKTVLEQKSAGSVLDTEWFVGGTLNLCYNGADRHVEAGFGDDTALVWESEPLNEDGSPEVRTLTYRDLQEQSARLGAALKDLGVQKGEIVTIYMGMVPELAISLLACARIGAAHSVIFGGFSAQAIADRIEDAQSRVVITADGLFRRGKIVPLKEKVDEAIDTLGASSVEHVISLTRCKNATAHQKRDHDYHSLLERFQDTPCPCEPLGAEEMSFLLYTSGSTGKPKGIQHSVGGYLVHAYLTAKYVFNLIPDSGQTFWCTADIGWITGHTYILYGILPNRVPTLLYEGAPDFPEKDRLWDIIERHQVTQFYTAPTAIRAFMKWGDEFPKRRDLSSLQVIGSVGEPINPEAWIWYYETIGAGKCPLVDTYWQTETGGHVITPLPGVTPTKPGSCAHPFFGIDAAVVDRTGREVAPNEGGLLVIRKPWPGMLRGVYGDRKRFLETYWSTVTIDGEPVYTAGDGARKDDDGYFWIMGRIDDVINVSGHRLGTMEIESALVSHSAVVEAAVVGMPHEVKGTGITAFVTLSPQEAERTGNLEALRDKIREHIAKEIGSIAKPDSIRFTDALPKTRSGKIMRRLLRDIASGKEEIAQDTSTLEDFSVLADLKEQDSS